MTSRAKSLMLFSAAALLPLAPLLAQARQPAPAPVPVAKPPMVQPAPPMPGNPATAAQPPPPPLPPPLWDQRNVVDLLSYIQGIGSEGLNPKDYDPDGLMAAMATGDPVRVSAEATDRFNRVSSDLAFGHVRRSARIDWHVSDPDLDPARQDAMLRAAIAQHNVAGALRNLLPSHPQYAALKAALAATAPTDTATIDRIRLNLDRWRWLPRDLGPKYIIVNVPGFHATLVEN